MQRLITLAVPVLFAGLLLALSSCNLLPGKQRPEHSAQRPAASAGKTAGTEASDAGDAGGASDTAADQPADADTDSADAADADPGTAADADGTADEGSSQEAAGDAAEASEESDAADDSSQAPAAKGVDLSGKWLPLFSRTRAGVNSEMWKTGKTVTISGSERQLEVNSSDDVFSLDQADGTGKFSNVRLSASGPFLIIDNGSESRTAYLRLGNSAELAAAGELSGRIAGQTVNGSFSTSAQGLKLQLDGGTSFSGKLANGSYFGFLEGRRQRGYCVLTMTGNGVMEGILFVDPYMSFETDLRFEVMQ